MHVLPKRVIVMVCDGGTLKCYSRSFTQVKYTVILYFHDNQYKIYSQTQRVSIKHKLNSNCGSLSSPLDLSLSTSWEVIDTNSWGFATLVEIEGLLRQLISTIFWRGVEARVNWFDLHVGVILEARSHLRLPKKSFKQCSLPLDVVHGF